MGASLPQPGAASGPSASCSGLPTQHPRPPARRLLTRPGGPLPGLPTGFIRLLQQATVRSRVIGEAPSDLCLNYGLLLKTCLILFL